MDFQVVGISPVFALASIVLYLWIFTVQSRFRFSLEGNIFPDRVIVF